MFRLSKFLSQLHTQQPLGPPPKSQGPVVIWNLLRRCNLNCVHCYATSTDVDFKGELTTQEAMGVLEQLKAARVRALILSGGEPLLRSDIFEIAQQAKMLGMHLSLSSNGTVLTQESAKRLAQIGFDYVGISIDGMQKTHDRFRRHEQAFKQAIQGIDRAMDAGLHVGLRMTLAQANVAELPQVLDLVQQKGISKFYLSHFNYAGRARTHQQEISQHQATRSSLDYLFDYVWQRIRKSKNAAEVGDFVTGNNDADGVYLLLWIAKHFPNRVDDMRQRLVQWGGNASGVNVANIDNVGNVHPDTMWWQVNLGNVLERDFSQIWSDRSHSLMAGLNAQPRPLKGRCATCAHRDICNGNTRSRAFAATGDAWAQDPGCYLSDEEIAQPIGHQSVALPAHA